VKNRHGGPRRRRCVRSTRLASVFLEAPEPGLRYGWGRVWSLVRETRDEARDPRRVLHQCGESSSTAIPRTSLRRSRLFRRSLFDFSEHNGFFARTGVLTALWRRSELYKRAKQTHARRIVPAKGRIVFPTPRIKKQRKTEKNSYIYTMYYPLPLRVCLCICI